MRDDIKQKSLSPSPTITSSAAECCAPKLATSLYARRHDGPASYSAANSILQVLSSPMDLPKRFVTAACLICLTPLLLLALAIKLPGLEPLQPNTGAMLSGEDVTPTKNLAKHGDRKVIRAGIRSTPATAIFTGGETGAGFEQQLIENFARSLGMALEPIYYNSVAEMYDALDRGDIDLVSSGYGASPVFTAPFKKGPSYRRDQLVAVYRVGQHRPRSVNGLVDKRLAVVKNSLPSSELLRVQQDLTDLNWGELPAIDYIDLLSRIENNELDVALMSKTDFQLYRGAFPKLGVAFSLSTPLEHRWVFGNGRFQHELLEHSSQYFVSAEVQKEIDVLQERYFSPSKNIKQFAAHEFSRNVRKRLPKYENLIKETAATYGMDWRFLAAISYQESNWLPKAQSRTGVRGMMMLTQNTAREMGITNRLDARKSFEGGAAYFKKLRSRLSASVTGPDRDWMALAAYNFGYGHLLDARALTAKNGGNPNLWHDVKETLPLLHKPEIYKKTRYGYARGREALTYVQHIRHYRNVLFLKDQVRAHKALLAESPNELLEVAALDQDQSGQDLAANL